MLSNADIPIIDVIKKLASKGVEAGYLVPTETGMKKSILDAHLSLRNYFSQRKIHDFDNQPQGKDSKVVVDINLVEADSLIKTRMSLYRPETKSGDPRLCVYGLTKYCEPWNLLVFIENKGNLYLVNTSSEEIFNSIDIPSSPLNEILASASESLDHVAEELIIKLKRISSMGFVDSMRSGSTGVGFTLETLLGIEANSNTAPDYFGIELKASRIGRGGGARPSSRVDLFAKVPDWCASSCKSGRDIIDRYGYINADTNRLQLYCTLSNNPNPQGLYLQVDETNGILDSLRKGDEANEKVVQWKIEVLQTILKEKHNQTFWVKAENKISTSGIEQFHYVKVERTQNPMLGNFGPLVEVGAITLDFTLKLIKKNNGIGERVRDRGYKFKIHPNNLDLLFPPSKSIPLI
jgi:hypothetical protein